MVLWVAQFLRSMYTFKGSGLPHAVQDCRKDLHGYSIAAMLCDRLCGARPLSAETSCP